MIKIRGVIQAANLVSATSNAIQGRINVADELGKEFNGDVIYAASIKQYLETLIGDLAHNGMDTEKQSAAMELADEIASGLSLVEAHIESIKAIGGTSLTKLDELFGMLKDISGT